MLYMAYLLLISQYCGVVAAVEPGVLGGFVLFVASKDVRPSSRPGGASFFLRHARVRVARDKDLAVSVAGILHYNRIIIELSLDTRVNALLVRYFFWYNPKWYGLQPGESRESTEGTKTPQGIESKRFGREVGGRTGHHLRHRGGTP